jgi:hypothetical protein
VRRDPVFAVATSGWSGFDVVYHPGYVFSILVKSDTQYACMPDTPISTLVMGLNEHSNIFTKSPGLQSAHNWNLASLRNE